MNEVIWVREPGRDALGAAFRRAGNHFDPALPRGRPPAARGPDGQLRLVRYGVRS
jgi:hypothetical protein